MLTYSFAQLDEALKNIIASGKKLIYLAGASASGKSFIAEQLAAGLQAQGKKVLTISSDNYYISDTGIRSMIYGTFDHPSLIEYSLLAKNIEEYFTKGQFMLPNYSFGESRRTGFAPIQAGHDYVIVEGLYTISQLPKTHDPLCIYIDASEEDLIMRRLLRDPARVGEPLHMVIGALNNVFPMWHIYGSTQENAADITIHNDYDLLAQQGKHMYHEPLIEQKDLGREYASEYVIEYSYNDTTSDDNGKIIITEHYDEVNGPLKSVGISKTQSTDYGKKETVKHISLRIYKPGMLTLVHNLIQNAGLHYEKVSSYDATSYLMADDKTATLEKRSTGSYVKYEQ